MNKEQFMNDLQALYLEIQDRQASLNGYYDLLDKTKEHERANAVVDAFLNLLEIPRNQESELATLTRVVNLREDALEQVLEKLGLSEKEIQVKKELAYGFVSTLHITRHESLIAWVESQKLLTPFYRALMFGMHFVGIRLSEWQSYWSEHIIYGVNAELKERFNGDDEAVMHFLTQEGLLDLAPNGEVGDRCYSVLQKDAKGNYKSVAYVEAFPQQVEGVCVALEQMMMLLGQYEDELFGQKEAWLAYLEALKEAFEHPVPNELIGKWAEVDRKWMAITTPLQIGHPLEYYEDHYRKAVALEWDLRIVNPRLQEGSPTRENIKQFASKMAQQWGEDAVKTIENNLKQVDETQLYIGQPILYYAAEFNGLFSAQVVPNDEQVSTELGKKIFAYADFVMESKRSKPIMKLSVESMGEAFVKKQKALIEQNPTLWQEIYDISTIGHEFGHILWIDAQTESQMNTLGQFKNIEEFKATSGGLMAFFHHEKEALKEHIVDDIISRAVGLMAWREVGEVLPYYCEGLIHLEILFGSGMITYNEKIEIDYSKYEAMKEAYIGAYEALAKHYLAKRDASEYLAEYTLKEEGVYLPKTKEVRTFVEAYYTRYKEIGQQTVLL